LIARWTAQNWRESTWLARAPLTLRMARILLRSASATMAQATTLKWLTFKMTHSIHRRKEIWYVPRESSR